MREIELVTLKELIAAITEPTTIMTPVSCFAREAFGVASTTPTAFHSLMAGDRTMGGGTEDGEVLDSVVVLDAVDVVNVFSV